MFRINCMLIQFWLYSWCVHIHRHTILKTFHIWFINLPFCYYFCTVTFAHTSLLSSTIIWFINFILSFHFRPFLFEHSMVRNAPICADTSLNNIYFLRCGGAAFRWLRVRIQPTPEQLKWTYCPRDFSPRIASKEWALLRLKLNNH